MTTVGIVGLGLIGGSLAKAFKENSDYRVLGANRSRETILLAKTVNAIDDELTDENIGECNLLLVALYPQSTIDYIESKKDLISKDTLVMDCCGVKQTVCGPLFELAEKCGFTFIGGHPMAGTQFSGFLKSRASLFKGASMIMVPPRFDDIELLDRAKQLLSPAGFGRYVVTTAQKHDSMIAFTSQMAHVVSNAFIKSPTAREHKGYSAGSYKDLTRVAWLNEDMWTELFMANRDELIKELGIYIDSLTEYKEALEEKDEKRLHDLLKEGRIAKEEVDGGR